MIGVFAASEVFRRVGQRDHALISEASRGATKVRVQLPSLAKIFRLRWTIIRSSLLGLWVGILPGAGATTAAILGYSTEVRLSKDPSGFGKGKIEGIARPESANNAAAVGAMIPLLSLGIPGSGTTAVMLDAFLIHNLQPGPFLFTNHADIVYGLFGGIALSNLAILLLSIGFIRLFARLVYLPYPVLATSILSICVIGSLAFGDVNAVAIMLVFAPSACCSRRPDIRWHRWCLGWCSDRSSSPHCGALLMADFDSALGRIPTGAQRTADVARHRRQAGGRGLIFRRGFSCDVVQSAAQRERVAPVRRPSDNDAAAGGGECSGARRLFRRRAARHRHVQPSGHTIRPARDPRGVRPSSPDEHGHAGSTLRAAHGRRYRRRRHKSLRPQGQRAAHRERLRRDPRRRLRSDHDEATTRSRCRSYGRPRAVTARSGSFMSTPMPM